MAFGGGNFVTQNKILPGSYVNFVSASAASSGTVSGTVAVPVALSWGAEGEMFQVTADEFRKNAVKLFGCEYDADELTGLRDLFLNADKCLLYRLNSGGVKASCDFAEARYPGKHGNKITVVVYPNEDTEEGAELWDVSVYFAGELIDEQLSVKAASDLEDNDFVVWKDGATLNTAAGTPLAGGTDGKVENAAYTAFLSSAESFSFNTVGLVSADNTVKSLFAAWTQRMRDEVGVKFQCVLHSYSSADHEGIISVENEVNGAQDSAAASLVWWVAGAQAACAVNKSLTNAEYNGEFDVSAQYTQAQLEEAVQSGKFILHRVDGSIRVLEDINTLTTVTEDKGRDFSRNQTVRVLDRIGNDIASLINSKYIGKIPNDAAGRISLQSDIVKHHKELAAIRAIEDFDPGDVAVEAGTGKGAVVITDCVKPANTICQIYMTVVAE